MTFTHKYCMSRMQLELASEAQLSELACRTTVAEQQAAGCQRDASDLERALNGGGPDRGEAVISGEALLRFLHERLKMKDVATAQCNLRSAALEVLLVCLLATCIIPFCYCKRCLLLSASV